jgi:hypothetical protein
VKFTAILLSFSGEKPTGSLLRILQLKELTEISVKILIDNLSLKL